METATTPFETREEERTYWDQADLTQEFADGQDLTLQWSVRDDRCERCGSAMQPRTIDVHLAGGRVTLRGIKLYSCPTCRHTKFPLAAERLMRGIEALLIQVNGVPSAPESQKEFA